VLILDQLERQVLADRQVAAALVAGGYRDSKDGLPSLHEQRERLDAALVEEPTPLTPADLDRLELLRVLGVAR
jgi:hypothetical protein